MSDIPRMDCPIAAESLSPPHRIKYGLAFGALTATLCAAIDSVAAVIWGNRIPLLLPAAAVAIYSLCGAAFGGMLAALMAARDASEIRPPSAAQAAADIRRACCAAFVTLFVMVFARRIRIGHQEYNAHELGAMPISIAIAVGLLFAFLGQARRGVDQPTDARLWRVACAAAACALWEPFTKTYHAPMLSLTSLLANAGFFGGLVIIYFLGRRLAAPIIQTSRLVCARRCAWSSATIGASGITIACAIAWCGIPQPIDLSLADHASAQASLTSHRRTIGDQPNVILIVMDTVRADRLSIYGYESNTTPNLAAFAAAADRYDQAIAPSSWTLPSHASLFTGLMPSEHRADNIMTDHGWTIHPLTEDYTTLTEVLRRSGYATGAVVANTACLSREFGLDQGFDHYDDYAAPTFAAAKPRTISPLLWLCHLYQREVEQWRTGWSRCADEVNANVFTWLDRVADRPFFLFINYIDPHAPYHSHPEFAAQLAAAAPEHSQSSSRFAADSRRYDEEIAYLDSRIGQLFKSLKDRGLFDRSIIVVTSDHGEAFGEHAQTGHGKSLYQEEVRVPLLVHFPGQSVATVHTEPTSLTEVPKWIADRLGLGFPSEAVADADPSWSRIMSELRLTERPDATPTAMPVMRAVFDTMGTKGLVESGGRGQLFDLLTDPRELRDLAASRGELMHWAVTLVTDWQSHLDIASQRNPPGSDLSPDLRDRLRSLGYLR